MYKKIDKVLLRINTVLSVLTYVGFVGIMLLMSADVLLRKLTGGGIIGTYEIVQYVLMAAVFASFAYTQSLKGHIKVTMLLHVMPEKVRYLLAGIMGLLSTAAAGVVAWSAVQQALYSMSAGTKSGVLGFPYYPFYWIEVVGMAAYAVVLLWDALKSFGALGSQELANAAEEDLSAADENLST